jgi:hypothetical protein
MKHVKDAFSINTERREMIVRNANNDALFDVRNFGIILTTENILVVLQSQNTMKALTYLPVCESTET